MSFANPRLLQWFRFGNRAGKFRELTIRASVILAQDAGEIL
jgi:hypothetical protein